MVVLIIEDVNNIKKFINIGLEDSKYLIFLCNNNENKPVYGLMNYETGEVIIKPELYDIDISSDKMTFVASNINNKKAIYSYSGTRLSPYYDYISSNIEGYRIVMYNGKYGLIDSKGNHIIGCTFLSISPPREGMTITYDYKRGVCYYNIEKRKYIKCIYGTPTDFCGGCSLQIGEKNNVVFVDKDGNVKNFFNNCYYENGFTKNKYSGTFVSKAIDRSNSSILLFDNKWNILINGYNYDKYELINTQYDMAIIKDKKTGLCGVVNYNNELIIPIHYITIEILSNGIIKSCKIPYVLVDYYDLEGNKLNIENVSFKNDMNNPSKYILGSVKKGEEYKLAFYDRHGNIAFNNLTFDEGENFKNNRAIIVNNEIDYRSNIPVNYKRYTVINEEGIVLFSYPKKDSFEFLESLSKHDNVYLGKVFNENEYIIISNDGIELSRVHSYYHPVISHGIVIYSNDVRFYGLSDIYGRVIDENTYPPHYNINIINSHCYTTELGRYKKLVTLSYYDNNYHIKKFDITNKEKEEKNTFAKRLRKIFR